MEEFRYGYGDEVRCICETGDPTDGLRLGEVYTVVGVNRIFEDVVYAVKNADGKILHSIDRFELATEVYPKKVITETCGLAGMNTDFFICDEPKFDPVAFPKHYCGGIEPLDYMESNMTLECFSGFLEGNIIKYVTRYKKKNGLQDLKKAQFYLDRLIKAVEGNNISEDVK